MKRSQADEETMAHNLLSSGLYARDSKVFRRAHRALRRLSYQALDALWVIECTKATNKKEVEAP